jgi:tetratricopeptide (TPR) repeat protein
VLGVEACAAAHAGRFERARELNRRAAEAAAATNQKESAANVLAWGALNDALVGNAGPARQQARAALALSDGWMAAAWSTTALALSGDFVAAKRMAGDLARRYPKATITQYWHLPMVESSLLLSSPHRKDTAANAIAILEKTSRFGLSPMDAAYLRGQAFLAAGSGEKAAGEFQKILDHSGVAVNLYDFQMALVTDLAHLGLGRAYSLAGNNEKARAAYQDFLAIWKDADPDVPLLKQAKVEYARLIGPQNEAAGRR